ncbi:MAG: hypothetical protein PHR26_00900 [Candidatus ainarchaeum sp.]|nr:hypothetical protein [Candidatus ainarchaeum sp.]MDD3976117.1 hypothetical protein [Candidatus ainarchaeum sp.]
MRDKKSFTIDLVTSSKKKADEWFKENDPYLWSDAKIEEHEVTE